MIYVLFWLLITGIVVAAVICKDSHPACLPQDDSEGIRGRPREDRRSGTARTGMRP